VTSNHDIEDQKLAAAVQSALLSCEAPFCKTGLIMVKNRMCTDVGGDFYHFSQLHNDQIAFALGDVMGHGTSAALIMSVIMGWLRNDRENYSRPGRIVENINNLLIQLGEQVGRPIICSMVYGVVDLPSGNLFYINAGHPYPIICNRSKCNAQKLGTTTMLLGVQSGIRGESCHQFSRDDRVVLYTDGLTDAANNHDDVFGWERLIQAVREGAGLSGEELTRKIFGRIDDYQHGKYLQDDQTLVVIDFDNVGSKD